MQGKQILVSLKKGFFLPGKTAGYITNRAFGNLGCASSNFFSKKISTQVIDYQQLRNYRKCQLGLSGHPVLICFCQYRDQNQQPARMSNLACSSPARGRPARYWSPTKRAFWLGWSPGLRVLGRWVHPCPVCPHT